ncbi:MAG TPA: ribonuclease PH [Thermodesulfovibrionales bacterium]|nr:ribonuclease PH [Thermodesulfovibrionales bacterium]
MRPDNRRDDQLRSLKITRNFIDTAEGSVLIELGRTRVICTASIEEKVPQFLKEKGSGWVTAEYAMLPRATAVRTTRESSIGRVGGRTHEIQRLIGRALRSVVNLDTIGQRTFWIDCDVIRADGGTRTAAITGAFICLHDAFTHAVRNNLIARHPVTDYLAAISVGVVGGRPVLDLCYEEDSSAEVDMNIVMTGSGNLVEVQGTAEGSPFSFETMNQLMELARQGISSLVSLQKDLIRSGSAAGSI